MSYDIIRKCEILLKNKSKILMNLLVENDLSIIRD